MNLYSTSAPGCGIREAVDEKGGDNVNEKERKVVEVPLRDISIDGETVRIDSPKLARILQAEKEMREPVPKALTLAPIVPAVSLKEVSTVGERVIIKSRDLARVVQAEKDAQDENMSVVMTPVIPLPPP